MLAFAEHLATVAVGVKLAEQHILEKAGAMVEKRAREKIGEYQEQAGPFIAWPELAESTKADRARQGYPEDEPLLRTGEMRDSIGHTVHESEVQIGSNDDKAVWQELGTEHIPPRSFLGGAMVESLPKINEMAGRDLVATLIGEKMVEGGILIGVSDV